MTASNPPKARSSVSWVDAGGAPFLIPPDDFAGFHIDGGDHTGIAIALGRNGFFTGFKRWSQLTVRNCDIAVDGFNFYSVSWRDITIQYNRRGIRITPVATGGDAGYFTATHWDGVHIADNAVYGLNVGLPLGSRTWKWTNVVIERNGADGAAQALLNNVTINGDAVYFEGSPGVPAIKQGGSVTYLGNDWLFGGTGGIDMGGFTTTMQLDYLNMTKSGDVIANVSSDSRFILSNSALQTDLSDSSAMAEFQNVQAGGKLVRHRQKTLGVGQAPAPEYQPNNASLLFFAQKVWSGAVPARGYVTIVSNEYFPGIMHDGVGSGSVGKFYPGLTVQVTTANSNDDHYYSVVLINQTAADIEVDAAPVTVMIVRGDSPKALG